MSLVVWRISNKMISCLNYLKVIGAATNVVKNVEPTTMKNNLDNILVNLA